MPLEACGWRGGRFRPERAVTGPCPPCLLQMGRLTEAHAPNTQSAVFFTPLYCLFGDHRASLQEQRLPRSSGSRHGPPPPSRRGPGPVTTLNPPSSLASPRAPEPASLPPLMGAGEEFPLAIPVAVLVPWHPVLLPLNPRCN